MKRRNHKIRRKKNKRMSHFNGRLQKNGLSKQNNQQQWKLDASVFTFSIRIQLKPDVISIPSFLRLVCQGCLSVLWFVFNGKDATSVKANAEINRSLVVGNAFSPAKKAKARSTGSRRGRFSLKRRRAKKKEKKVIRKLPP